MADTTKIEWADKTFNPWIGCQKVGPGCDHCYAEAMMADRYGRVEWGPHGSRSQTSAANWKKPLAWDRAAAKAGRRDRVFCASLADVFDNHHSVLPEWRRTLFTLIAHTPNLDWLLLTKRPGNIAEMLPIDWGDGWPNVWLGCTVVNQAEADRDIPKLLAVPAAVHFLSIEPMLGPVDLWHWVGVHHHPANDLDIPETRAAIEAMLSAAREKLREDHGSTGIDWVICGGESGKDARPMHPDWARSLRDQCRAAGVAFHFKQWGEWADCTDAPHRFQVEDFIFTANGQVLGAGHPRHGGLVETGWEEKGGAWMSKVGKARAGRLLRGREWNEVPHGKP